MATFGAVLKKNKKNKKKKRQEREREIERN
jgi:hypothetical protein